MRPPFQARALPRPPQLLKVPVVYVDDCIGDKVQAAVNTAPKGSVLLLENVRFYPAEEENGADFAKQLAAPASIYVNDAFGTAHRAHASTEGVTKYLKPNVAGFLLQKELDYLARARRSPSRRRPLQPTVGKRLLAEPPRCLAPCPAGWRRLQAGASVRGHRGRLQGFLQDRRD